MIDGLLRLLVVTVGVTSGLQVGPVRLRSKGYISYQKSASEDNSLIECPVVLRSSEELKEVSWNFTDAEDKVVGKYVWSATSGGNAEGLLEDVVRLDRTDGGLELLELRYDLAGFYSCSATTEEGETGDAAAWEVLIVDVTSNSPIASLGFKDECEFESSFKMSAIYPQPTLHSGLYSDSLGGFVEEVSSIDWHKQMFQNGSYTYAHQNVIFKITEKTPHDVYFLNNVGISKRDSTYISLMSVESIYTEFKERGCHPVKTDAYQTVDYSNGGAKTCRKELRQPSSGQLKATVRCMDGYKAAGDSTYESMELTCNPKFWEWGVSNEHPSLSHIKCIIDDDDDYHGDGGAFAAVRCPLLLLLCAYLQRLLQ
ncbi:uncharacterized protein [Palaemon carinicauda]|uniref:uncharacterized protein n=1 Tax=Palaemon carinicauda TaxID=392227 RepID=UPI0035B5A33B